MGDWGKIYIMEGIVRNPKLQEEEINQKVLDKIAFNCPHCGKEINETHLDEKGKYFQYVKEKIRKATEEEVNYQRDIQKKQLLEQIEVGRGYEKFAEVVKDKRTIEELTKVNKELKEEMLREKLKFKDDLAKAISYDEIRKLEGFKELEQKLEKYQKENEELKTGNQPEIQELKETIKKLEEEIVKQKLETEKVKSSEEVEKLDRVKELKEEVDKWKKEWVDKLEKDMVNERAEYGVIIASCQNGQPLLKPFPQKNILVSDDENFIFASQVARMLIFSRQRLNQDENSKERIERLDGWIKENLPNYLLKLENNLRDWEKDIMGITTIVKSMTKTREEIKRITINEIALELREI